MNERMSSFAVCFGLLGLGATVAIGLVKLGGHINSMNNKMVEVKGLSEKVVRSDLGKISIHFSNDGFRNLEDLYKKRTQDKEKILAFLKKHNITEEEIYNHSTDTWDYTEDKKTTNTHGETITDKEKFFRGRDTISIKTTDLEKINKVKNEIMKLSSEGVLITYDYSYHLTNFRNIKLEMMKDASVNARKNAEVFVEPQGYKIDDVLYLKQGEVTITGENEGENVESWNSEEKQSINKKLRLVIRAGFSKKK